MKSPRFGLILTAVAVLGCLPTSTAWAAEKETPKPVILITPLGAGPIEDQSWLREARERAELLESIEFALYGVKQSAKGCHDRDGCGPWIEFNSCCGYCGWNNPIWHTPWWNYPYRQFPVYTHPCWAISGRTVVDFSYPCGRYSYWCR